MWFMMKYRCDLLGMSCIFLAIFIINCLSGISLSF
uniref:Uncharacterized protein n=1 Tax=Rhizophora mucronata TaxID=61149 RepID=A0A2P2QZB6_RHIMU